MKNAVWYSKMSNNYGLNLVTCFNSTSTHDGYLIPNPIICVQKEYMIWYNCNLVVLRIVLWSYSCLWMWQYIAGRSPLFQPPKPLIAILSSSGFFHLRPGVFHISLETHKTQRTQRRGLKKRKQTNTDLAKLQVQEGRSLWHFPSILWAITSGYLSKIPTKSSGMLTHPLMLANPASESTHPSSLSCWLPCSVHFSALPSSLDCQFPPTSVDCPVLSTCLFCPLLLTLGPSVPRLLPVSWEILCTTHLGGFHTKTDKGIFWLVLTHTHTMNAQHRVTQRLIISYLNPSFITVCKQMKLNKNNY